MPSALLIYLTSCKKYSEDGHVSLSTAKQRLIKKNWKLKSYLVNDVDSISNPYPYELKINNVTVDTITRDLNKIELIFDSPNKATCNDYSTSDWKLVDDKQMIHFYFNRYLLTSRGSSQSVHYITFPHNYSDDWKILKLTKDDFIIEMNTTIKNIRLTFRH